MNAPDPSAPDRRQGGPGGLVKLLALLAWVGIGAASLSWLAMIVTAVARGHAGPGLLVIAPIPTLMCGIATVGVRAAVGPLRGRFRALDRRRALG